MTPLGIPHRLEVSPCTEIPAGAVQYRDALVGVGLERLERLAQ
jgi:hypothetical protein